MTEKKLGRNIFGDNGIYIINASIGMLYDDFIVYVGINYIDHLAVTGITSFSPMRLPMTFVFLAVSIDMFFLAWYYFTVIVSEIKVNPNIPKNPDQAIQEMRLKEKNQ